MCKTQALNVTPLAGFTPEMKLKNKYFLTINHSSCTFLEQSVYQ